MNAFYLICKVDALHNQIKASIAIKKNEEECRDIVAKVQLIFCLEME